MTADFRADFESIRKRLTSLDYGEYLNGLDQNSIFLVQKLLSDLISTTQAFREQKLQATSLQQALYGMEERVTPLERKLRDLEEENLVLHQEIISLRDEKDAIEMKNMDLVKTLQTRMHDLEFMNSQLKAALALEKQHTRKALAKVEDFTEKIALPTTSSMTDRRMVFERIQKIDLETGLAPVEGTSNFKVNPEFVDLVSIAEEKIFELIDEEEKERLLREEQSKARSAMEESNMLRDMISKRDEEIQRLASKIMQRSNTTAKILDTPTGMGENPGDLQAAKERIANLEMQLEALGFHLESLESEIANNESVKAGLINDIQSQKDRVEMELEKERKKNEALIKQVDTMDGFVKEVEGLRKGKDINSVIKPSTGVKNAKLVQELTTKVNTLSSKLETTQKRLNMALKAEKRIESENRELKIVVNKLEKEVEAKKSNAVPGEKEFSIKSSDEVNRIKIEMKKLENLKNLISDENKALTGRLQTVQNQIIEKDSTIKILETSQTSLQAQITQYERERDMLLKSLEEFESETNVVISSVEKVTSERDSFKNLYIQVNSELEKLRQTPKPVDQPLLQFDQLRQENHKLLEKEKKLIVQVEALKSDLNAILTRQRETGSLANEAASALDVELEDLKLSLKTSLEDQKMKENKIEELEKEIKKLQALNQDALTKSELDQKRASQLELDVEKLKLEIRELKNSKLSLEEKIKEYQNENSGLERKIQDMKRESGNTRQLLDEIDKERDQFQNELDLKTEKLAELQDLLSTVQKKYKESEEASVTLKDQIDALTSHLSNSDKECSKLSRDLAEALTSSQHWETQAKQHHIEGQRLGSDLIALTRENQILNGELSETAATRDRYRAELSELEHQLNSLNEFVKSKDHEKQEMMGNYRKLIADHERLDLAYKSNMEELNHLRMEVVSRDKKLISLERQLDSVTRDATQFQIDNNAHLKQNSNLSRALATSERQIKQLEVEKQRLSREVQACRELAHSVDRNKDSLQAQFVQLNLERDRLVHSLEKSASEKQAMEAQLKSEMLKTDRLEQLLNAERTRIMESERSSIDIKHSRAEMEMKLKELSDNQEIAINSTKLQLNEAKKELTAATLRISHLETILGEKDRELRQTSSELEKNNAEIVRLKERLQIEQTTNKDLIKIYGDSLPNAVEMRLLGEISNTQRERQYAETQLESAMMPSFSDASIASKDTAGNNDLTASRRMETVLDTIVQAREEEES